MEQGKKQGAKGWVDNGLKDSGIKPAIGVLIANMNDDLCFYP